MSLQRRVYATLAPRSASGTRIGQFIWPDQKAIYFLYITRLIRTQLYGHRLIRTMDIFLSPELHVYMYTPIYGQPRFTRPCLTEHRLRLNILLHVVM